MSIAANRFYDPALTMTSVPGALQKYDLPDLENSLPEGVFSKHCRNGLRYSKKVLLLKNVKSDEVLHL